MSSASPIDYFIPVFTCPLLIVESTMKIAKELEIRLPHASAYKALLGNLRAERPQAGDT